VSPSQAAKSRPLAKLSAGGANASMAIAQTTPALRLTLVFPIPSH
jgi:hypothetical protein